jgi:hypothetical protein
MFQYFDVKYIKNISFVNIKSILSFVNIKSILSFLFSYMKIDSIVYLYILDFCKYFEIIHFRLFYETISNPVILNILGYVFHTSICLLLIYIKFKIPSIPFIHVSRMKSVLH